MNLTTPQAASPLPLKGGNTSGPAEPVPRCSLGALNDGHFSSRGAG